MDIVRKVTRIFGRRPLTDEDLEARRESKLMHDQLRDARAGQLGGADRYYEPDRRR